MNCRLLSLIPTAAIGLAFLGSTARADLVLSGETTGSFVDMGQPNTTVVNNPGADTALWESGIPEPPSTLQTSILFQGQDFTDVTSGEAIDVGLFTIHNGIDELHSTADTAVFNLGLALTSPSSSDVALTTFTFDINNTPNNPSLKPDQYGVTFTEPGPEVIDGNLVQFNVVFSPPIISVGEGMTTTRGDVFVTFTPVPEPSTYALWGALLVGGIIVYRRFGTMIKSTV
jgi:hypothetical protein